MFSCPTDDIHSIYLDKELPNEFIVQYESHISTCVSCQQKLARLRKVHELLQTDSQSITMDSVYLQQGYSRLKTKMHYSKNTNASYENAPSHIIPYVASLAAAVVLAIVLPVGLKSKNASFEAQASVSKITPIERPQNTAISNKNIFINENINDNLAQSVNFGNFGNVRFADVDVFRPHFGERILFYGPIDGSELGRFLSGRVVPHSSMQGPLPFPVTEMQDYRSE